MNVQVACVVVVVHVVDVQLDVAVQFDVVIVDVFPPLHQQCMMMVD
jgi:hypothetical protein